MAGPYTIALPVKGQPIPATLFGRAVRDAISDLHTRVGTIESNIKLCNQRTTDSGAITGTTLVTALTVTLPRAGQYAFDALVTLTNTVAVGRPGFALGGTSVPTSWRWIAGTVHYNSAAAQGGIAASGTTFPAATAGTALVNTDFTTTTGWSFTHIKGLITVSSGGTLDFRFSEAAGAGTVTIRNGSIVTVDFVV